MILVTGVVVRVGMVAVNVNVAVAVRVELIETVHVPVPLHPAPDQPVNVPVVATAVKVTEAPEE